MAVIVGELYDALRSAGAEDDKAKRATTEVADFDNRLSGIDGRVTLLTWMVGTVVTLQIMTLGGLIGLVWKLFPGP